MANDSLVTTGRFLVASDNGLKCVRWYRSSGASQRCGEYLSNELADNTTSKFLK
jgi:hypothetical protein